MRARWLALSAMIGCGSVSPEARGDSKDEVRRAAAVACINLRPEPAAHVVVRLAWAFACGFVLNPQEGGR